MMHSQTQIKCTVRDYGRRRAYESMKQVFETVLKEGE